MKTKRSEDRRKFLLAAGMGSAGAAAIAAGVRAKGASQAATGAEPGKDGYRVTEHILKYYKTTQV